MLDSAELGCGNVFEDLRELRQSLTMLCLGRADCLVCASRIIARFAASAHYLDG